MSFINIQCVSGMACAMHSAPIYTKTGLVPRFITRCRYINKVSMKENWVIRGNYMKQLRLRAILLACWLIGFYMMAHFWEPFNVSPITYLFILVLVIFILTTPHMKRVHLWWMLTVPALVYFAIKTLMELPILGSALPITIIETCAIIFTTLLLLWVRNAIHEFERAVADFTIGKREGVIETAIEGQSILYREVRG